MTKNNNYNLTSAVQTSQLACRHITSTVKAKKCGKRWFFFIF